MESLDVPEAAVACDEEFLFRVALGAGSHTAEILEAPGDWQPMLLCHK